MNDYARRIKPNQVNARNFMVDYNLPGGVAAHGPFQGFSPDCSDDSVIAILKRHVKTRYDGKVTCIVEAMGSYSMEELERIQESEEAARGVVMRLLYCDPEEVERGK